MAHALMLYDCSIHKEWQTYQNMRKKGNVVRGKACRSRPPVRRTNSYTRGQPPNTDSEIVGSHIVQYPVERKTPSLIVDSSTSVWAMSRSALKQEIGATRSIGANVPRTVWQGNIQWSPERGMSPLQGRIILV